MDHPTIKKNIEKAIREGRITMKPRWRFACAGALSALLMFVVVLLTLFAVGFIFFSFHETGPHALPWLLLTVSVICLATLEALVRRFPICYRQPILYSGAIVLLLMVGGGLLISYTSFHRQLREREHGLYDMIGPRHQGDSRPSEGR